MEDVINLTLKQVKGLVYHLNEELYRQQVHGDNNGRIISTVILNACVNLYNSPNISDSVEEHESKQYQLELKRVGNEKYLVHGLKLSDKEYNEAFKDS